MWWMLMEQRDVYVSVTLTPLQGHNLTLLQGQERYTSWVAQLCREGGSNGATLTVFAAIHSRDVAAAMSIGP